MRFIKKIISPCRIRVIALVLLLLIVVFAIGCGISSKKEQAYTQKTATMQKMFEAALKPVGSTMYIWGGGWSQDDAKAGKTATQIGVDERWKEFADNQDAEYDFKEHMGEQESGLDCSGYVGWVLYNVFEETNGQEGYVSFSTGMAETLAQKGFGKLIKNPQTFIPGDIVSMQGHVWICLGTCEDGSVLLIHSSPPGVSICGTDVPGAEGTDGVNQADSMAIRLAEEYMCSHYPKWQEKYPNRAVSAAYLENVTLLRWNSDTLKDAKKYQSLSGEQIMELH